jgi:RNA polymerase sigma factor (sigma-70 family)
MNEMGCESDDALLVAAAQGDGNAIAIDDEDLLAIEQRAAAGAVSVERLLEELPAEQRAAIRARVLDERDYAEIALELECSTQVVRQRVSRGLRTLRARIGEGS